MCYHSHATYACGHQGSFIHRCQYPGSEGCRLIRRPPLVSPSRCSYTCAGSWAPPPPRGWDRWRDSILPAIMGYPTLGPEVLPHISPIRHMPMASQPPRSTYGAPIPSFPNPNPLNPANYTPSVAGPASNSVQRPAPVYRPEFPHVSNIINMANGSPVQQGGCTSPHRPRAPVAPMSPGLPDIEEPSVVEQRYKTKIEDTYVKEEPSSDDD
ncbi:hypothetical protein F5Y09DRAFT_347585 [Xylaria sp. FL1042]|nr:hypothetical protein F5Y09DRAFT_347585 [Xylaria sp. FL1042]